MLREPAPDLYAFQTAQKKCVQAAIRSFVRISITPFEMRTVLAVKMPSLFHQAFSALC